MSIIPPETIRYSVAHRADRPFQRDSRNPIRLLRLTRPQSIAFIPGRSRWRDRNVTAHVHAPVRACVCLDLICSIPEYTLSGRVLCIQAAKWDSVRSSNILTCEQPPGTESYQGEKNRRVSITQCPFQSRPTMETVHPPLGRSRLRR